MENAEIRALLERANPAPWTYGADWKSDDFGFVRDADNRAVADTFGIGDGPIICALRNEAARLLDAADERDALRAEVAALRGLLGEWLETPFFESRAEWEKWVSEFRPRVAAARGEGE